MAPRQPCRWTQTVRRVTLAEYRSAMARLPATYRGQITCAPNHAAAAKTATQATIRASTKYRDQPVGAGCGLSVIRRGRLTESRLSCGHSARGRKAVERQTTRLASEATQFFPTCERPAASSAG